MVPQSHSKIIFDYGTNEKWSLKKEFSTTPPKEEILNYVHAKETSPKEEILSFGPPDEMIPKEEILYNGPTKPFNKNFSIVSPKKRWSLKKEFSTIPPKEKILHYGPQRRDSLLWPRKWDFAKARDPFNFIVVAFVICRELL